jgi:hypothetical protein
MIPVEKWYAFKAKLPQGSTSEHRVIIVHKHMSVIKYFYVTSQVENVIKLAKYDTESIVKLNADDWDVLTKESCIRCDKRHLYEISEDCFRQSCSNGEIERLGKIPEKIKNSIIYAVCMSKSFTEAEKTAYTT